MSESDRSEITADEGYGRSYFAKRARAEAQSGKVRVTALHCRSTNMMFDLTNTSFAEASERMPVPTAGELMAIMAALVVTSWCNSAEPGQRVLALTNEDFESVALLLEFSFPALAQNFGGPSDFRSKLRKFIGLKVCLGDGAGPFFT